MTDRVAPARGGDAGVRARSPPAARGRRPWLARRGLRRRAARARDPPPRPRLRPTRLRPAPTASAIELADALRAAEEADPALRGALADVKAAEARARRGARAPAEPVARRVGRPAPARRRADSTDAEVALSQPVELAGQRARGSRAAGRARRRRARVGERRPPSPPRSAPPPGAPSRRRRARRSRRGARVGRAARRRRRPSGSAPAPPPASSRTPRARRSRSNCRTFCHGIRGRRASSTASPGRKSTRWRNG